jgi:Tfp pilus assembly protein PilX
VILHLGDDELMNKESGLALMTVLIFLQIIAILGLFAVESAIETQKMARLDWEQTNIFLIVEQELHQIETQLIKSIPPCIIPVTTQSDLLNKPLSWWQSSTACQGELQTFSYFYVIEKLGIDPCADLHSSEKSISQPKAVAYMRINLLVLDKKKESKEVLQSTVVTLDNAVSATCQGLRHPVFLGRQMWREPR